MNTWQHLIDFLEPVNLAMISGDEGYKDGQIGSLVDVFEDTFPSLDGVDMILLGCNETRGSWQLFAEMSAPDKIRHQFYATYQWHVDLKIVDIGNIKRGAGLSDTYAALKLVISELNAAGKTVIILGGSHDLTLAQYYAYAHRNKQIEAIVVDALINLNIDSQSRNENFLMEMLTGEPNYLRHYNHVGFQSYYVHPRMLETMDKLRFDCYRLGHVKEQINEMEPVIRNAELFSFDIAAIANAYAPASQISPNGLNGEEACTLMQFAGMSANINTVGIYGYRPELDREDLTAKQISHMLWYWMDGRVRGSREADLKDRESFNEFHLAFAEVETVFLQSKKTGRWWMQLPDQQFIACSYNDYQLAASNEIPERWLRAQERSI